MAATLAWIKSRMLLPPDPSDDGRATASIRAPSSWRACSSTSASRRSAGELGERPLLGRDVFAARAHGIERAARGASARSRSGCSSSSRRCAARSRAAAHAGRRARGGDRDDHRARAHARGDGGARGARGVRVRGAARGRTAGCASALADRRDVPRDPRARPGSRRSACTRASTSSACRAARSTCAARGDAGATASGASASSESSCEGGPHVEHEDASRARIVEAIILAASEPIAPARIAAVDARRATRRRCARLVDELNAEYAEQRPRASRSGRWRAATSCARCPEFAPLPAAAPDRRAPLRLSRGRARDARGDRLPPAGDARRDRARPRRRRGRGAAQPARPPAGADRGPPRGAGPADRLRHDAALPRGVRARQARRTCRRCARSAELAPGDEASRRRPRPIAAERCAGATRRSRDDAAPAGADDDRDGALGAAPPHAP